MVCIFKRNDSKRDTYRVAIRFPKMKKLFLTFSTEEDAKKWVIKHIDNFKKDPEHYHKCVTIVRKYYKRGEKFYEELEKILREPT